MFCVECEWSCFFIDDTKKRKLMNIKGQI